MNRLCFFISDLSSGGAERVCSILANHFSKNTDMETFIFTIGTGKPFYKLSPKVKILQLNKKNKSSSKFGALKSNLSRILTIRNTLKENKIDVVISFMTESNVIMILSSIFLNINLIVSDRANPRSHIIPRIWLILSKTLYRFADTLVVQTKGVLPYYNSHKASIQVIPNPINIQPDITLENKKKIVLSVGRLVKSKRHDLVIEAFKEAALENWQLHILGDGPEKNHLVNLIEENELGETVIMHGVVHDVFEHYKTASIFLSMSTQEGYPNALIESMCNGLACISTNCDFGPSEIIDHGQNGTLIDLNSVTQAAQALKDYAYNSQLRHKAGQSAMELNQKLKVESVARLWEDLF